MKKGSVVTPVPLLAMVYDNGGVSTTINRNYMLRSYANRIAYRSYSNHSVGRIANSCNDNVFIKTTK